MKRIHKATGGWNNGAPRHEQYPHVSASHYYRRRSGYRPRLLMQGLQRSKRIMALLPVALPV